MKNRKNRAKNESAPGAVAVSPPRSGFVWWHYALGLFGLLFVAFEVYGPALNGQFLFDDSYLPFFVPSVVNEPLRVWLGVRPLLMTTYWLNYKMSGLDPYPYHVVGLLFHIVNSILAGLIVRRFLEWAGTAGTLRTMLSVFAGTLFLLHPLQTESVAYIASRSETMSVFFFLAAYAIFVYRRKVSIGILPSVLILILFGAACLTKEHTTVLPILLLLTDYYFNPGFRLEGIRRNWKLYVPILIGAAFGVAVVLRVLKYSPSAGFQLKGITWYDYLFTQFRSICIYLRMYLLPFGQNVDYDFPISHSLFEHWAIAYLAVLLALVFLALRYRREYPLASFGFLGYLILLAPTSSVVPINDALVERRLYLPFICLLLITVEFLRRWKTSRATLGMVLTAVVAIAGGLSYQRNHVWANGIALWSDATEKAPAKSRPRFQLAFAYYQAGQCPQAVNEYEKVAKLDSTDERLFIDWALAYDCAQQPDQALAKLQQAARITENAHVYSLIGLIHAKRGNATEALRALDTAEKLDPRFEMTYVYRGNVYAGMEDFVKAAEQYGKALTINPASQPAKDGLAMAAAQRKL
jgi:tetratricopeptide (TPR) repeat protein